MPPFSAERRDGRIILTLDEDQFLAGVLDGADGELRLVDREAFLRFALQNLFTLTHDVSGDARFTWWHRLSESLGKAAAATDQGIRRLRTAEPTCGCDPETHDGG